MYFPCSPALVVPPLLGREVPGAEVAPLLLLAVAAGGGRARSGGPRSRRTYRLIARGALGGELAPLPCRIPRAVCAVLAERRAGYALLRDIRCRAVLRRRGLLVTLLLVAAGVGALRRSVLDGCLVRGARGQGGPCRRQRGQVAARVVGG